MIDQAERRLVRGSHELPHQAQMIRRDLDGETITRNPGAVARVYRLTDEQIASQRWMYEWIVTAPDQPAFSWTAFHTADALQAWLDAYDLVIDRMPARGEGATITLPMTADGWAPLTGTE